MDRNNSSAQTMAFAPVKEQPDTPESILMRVYSALKAKGYDPINQLVGYLISGDPTYITSYGDARSLICRMERDEILEEIISYYVKAKGM